MGGAHVVKSEVEHQDIHTGFTKDPELPWFDMTVYEGLDIVLAQVPLTGDPMDLVVCGGNTEVRVKPACRCRNEIDRNRKRVGRIRDMKFFDSGFHNIGECRVRGSEIRT
jgi:hypothetical protein